MAFDKTLIRDISRHESIGRVLEVPPQERIQLQRAVLAYGEAFLQALPGGKAYTKEGYPQRRRRVFGH